MVGYHGEFPFRYRYMLKLWNCTRNKGAEKLQRYYIMATASVCFYLRIVIDEMAG